MTVPASLAVCRRGEYRACSRAFCQPMQSAPNFFPAILLVAEGGFGGAHDFCFGKRYSPVVYKIFNAFHRGGGVFRESSVRRPLKCAETWDDPKDNPTVYHNQVSSEYYTSYS